MEYGPYAVDDQPVNPEFSYLTLIQITDSHLYSHLRLI